MIFVGGWYSSPTFGSVVKLIWSLELQQEVWLWTTKLKIKKVLVNCLFRFLPVISWWLFWGISLLFLDPVNLPCCLLSSHTHVKNNIGVTSVLRNGLNMNGTVFYATVFYIFMTIYELLGLNDWSSDEFFGFWYFENIRLNMVMLAPFQVISARGNVEILVTKPVWFLLIIISLLITFYSEESSFVPHWTFSS